MKRQGFLKGSLILMLSAVAAKVFGALFKIPLTNMLGGVGMGYFSCAYSLFMPLYGLIVTGISSAVARMTAASAALGMYENARRIRRTGLFIFSAAGVPASLLMIVLAKPFSVVSSGSQEAALAVAMIAPAVFLGCITAVERGYYEGMSNMLPTAFSQVAEGVVKVAAGLWLCGYVTRNSDTIMSYVPWVRDERALAAAAGILGVTVSSAGAVLFFGVMRLFRGESEKGSSHLESRRVIAKQLVRDALPIGLSAVVTNFTAIIDMWTVIGCLRRTGAYSGVFQGVSADEVPQFVYGSFAGIALTVFNLVPSVTNMLGKGALTSVASARERGSVRDVEKSSAQVLLTACIMAVPAAVGLGIMAPEVLCILFPRQSDEVRLCISSLRWLMPGMVCLCVVFPVFSMLQGLGRADLPLKIMLAGTALKLAGNLLLIPAMGLDGAAVSTSLSYAIILAAALRIYFRTAGISPEITPFLKVLYAGAVCGGAAFVAAGTASGCGELVTLAAAAVAGAAAYFAALWVTLGKDILLRQRKIPDEP